MQQNFKGLVLSVALCALSLATCMAQDQSSAITLRGGYRHASFLDRQANPLIYQANGPGFGLAYESFLPNAFWEVGLTMSLQDMQVKDKERRWKTPGLSATSAQLSVRYQRPIVQTAGGSLWLGGVLQQDFIVDFEGVGGFPWLFGQGAFSPELAWKMPVTAAGELSLGLGAPLVGWVTDMPFHQVPRILGEVPGVNSMIKKGTRLTWWHNYQRVHAQVAYRHTFSDNWSGNVRYDFLWWHDALPLDFWGYQGLISVGVSRHF